MSRPAAELRNLAYSVVTGILDQKRFVSTLVKMSGSLVAFGVPIRVAGKPMLHPIGEIRLGRLDQRMDMIWHPAVGQDDPARSAELRPGVPV